MTREIKSKVVQGQPKKQTHEGATKISKGSRKVSDDRKKGGCC